MTYHTDEEATRLDRIRFWLINEQQERTLYPKKDEYVSNIHTPNERMAVITHLPAGNYQIEFLVPNTDAAFEEIPPRKIDLAQGMVVKFEQAIRLRNPPLKEIFAEVPAGLALIGDPFLDNPQNERPAQTVNIPAFAIGVYAVTNTQFANWLNDALKDQKAFFGDPAKPGYILNAEKKSFAKLLRQIHLRS